MTTPVLLRVMRRETHSPRTVAMIVAVVMLILLAVYAGIEIVLWLAGQPPLLVGPGNASAWLVALPTLQPAAAIIAGSAVLALIGLVFVVLAVTPGRLAKHRMQDDDRAVVVDNGVIAAALAQHLSDRTGLARADITVGVGHRSADVTLRPAAGVELDDDEVRAVVAAELDSYRLVPPVTPRVRITLPKDSEPAR